MNIGEKTEIWTDEPGQESHGNGEIKIKLKCKIIENVWTFSHKTLLIKCKTVLLFYKNK